ncbi:MAG TPA: RNB domain-containing ribonuclease [Stackebrandtia sp.]|uniref:RNB domain-containing ribonuclease n=1 Tax=Stackebrandtia sp. TaxID=2023065 RepID=UPI002D5D338A|nr:RNB domain-containing ribonuclease [Stackebrandtia sp.]HZE38264.1 RNB domain-containing ribonuclease [Stackebrandtia sp.]
MADSDDTKGVMIDAPDTADRDDAVWVRRTDAGFDAWVHVALVARQLPRGGDGDAEARRRMHSKYLPDRTISMLPAAVESASSLRAGREQDTLTVHMRFDEGAESFDTHVSTGCLRESWELSYAEAAAALTDPATPLHARLTDAHTLASALLRRRQRTGALAFYDLFKGYATNEEGQLVRLGDNQRHAGYIIVQELMIASNAAIAMWCAARDLPILFRNHRAAAVAGDRAEMMGELAAAEARGDADAYETLRKRMGVVQRPATYDPAVYGHFGLNLPAYAHTTSPLRRYADLINQRILLAATAGQPSPYGYDELADIGTDINARIAAAREARAAHHKRAAQAATRQRLHEPDLTELDPGDFAKVIKLALRHDRPPAALPAEVKRRLDADTLPLRDACEILIHGGGADWRALREDIHRRIAAEPSRALTVVNMYAQSVVGGPMSDAHLRWDQRSVGTIQKPCFEATLRLELGDTPWTSPARVQASKKDAKAQAALALVARIAHLDDLSESIPVPDPLPANDSGPRRLPDGLNPLMALNEYTQSGTISDLTWTFDQTGPAHQPEFTCRARVTGPAGQPLEATGTGTGKQAAKTAAATRLRELIDAHLDEPGNPP